MSKKEFFKEDIINLLGGATSILNSVKEEIEERVKDRVEKTVHKLNLVDKEDFDIVMEILEKSRIENEKLNKRVVTLESKITRLSRLSKK